MDTLPPSPTAITGTAPAEAADPARAPADTSYAFHTDHQGSVRALTDGAGTVVASHGYGAYGDIETSVSSLGAGNQPFRYTGREWDEATGLTHYRARAYDPATGRFLQEDPIWFQAGDLNVYRYTWNNPVNWTDPSGLFSGISCMVNAQHAANWSAP